jgi:hypothetical protein
MTAECRRHRVRLVAMAVATGLLTACGGGGSDGASSPDPQVCSTADPVDAAKLTVLPKDLPLDDWGAVMRVERKKGYVGAQVITETSIIELYPEISRAVLAGGYETISSENEGFEAELFFRKGPDTGTFLLRKGPCKGQVTVRLLYGSTPISPSMTATPN